MLFYRLLSKKFLTNFELFPCSTKTDFLIINKAIEGSFGRFRIPTSSYFYFFLCCSVVFVTINWFML